MWQRGRDGAVGRGDSSQGRRGRLSAHFTADELACPHCGACFVTDELVAGLERLRSIVGRPVTLRSGYRCPQHNHAVGGAEDSQHVYGRAADLVEPVGEHEAHGAGFRGLGLSRGRVIHVDVRAGAATWSYDK